MFSNKLEINFSTFNLFLDTLFSPQINYKNFYVWGISLEKGIFVTYNLSIIYLSIIYLSISVDLSIYWAKIYEENWNFTKSISFNQYLKIN